MRWLVVQGVKVITVFVLKPTVVHVCFGALYV